MAAGGAAFNANAVIATAPPEDRNAKKILPEMDSERIASFVWRRAPAPGCALRLP
jgi:hypothetical protein